MSEEKNYTVHTVYRVKQEKIKNKITNKGEK